MPRTVKRVRDITLCHSLVLRSYEDAKAITAAAEDGEYNPALNRSLVDNLLMAEEKLRLLNAATGRRERGKGAALNPVASTARKAGARRR